MAAVVALLDRLERRAGGVGTGAYAAVLAFAVLALAGAIGMATTQPWLFPSLGPTLMMFFESGRQPAARPQNALVGHLVGVLVGWGFLHLLGLAGATPAPVGGLTWPYVWAAASSVAVTSLVLLALQLPHPPAGASTLIVSLGILSTGVEIATMLGAVVLVTAAGWALNLLLGLRPHSSRP